MKKKLFLPFLALAVMVISVSCSKSDTQPTNPVNVSLDGKWTAIPTEPEGRPIILRSHLNPVVPWWYMPIIRLYPMWPTAPGCSLLSLLSDKQGVTGYADRELIAARAFNQTSHYATAIFNYFNRDRQVSAFKQSIMQSRSLRYGENPHQQAAFYGKLSEAFEQLHGKEISYNNLVDIESCMYLMEEFEADKSSGKATFAIIKHKNACGLATAITVSAAWDKALAADPVSAFGGVLICNQPIDVAAADKINNLFFEVLIAPAFPPEALEILKTKKNRILLVQRMFRFPAKQFTSMLHGVLVQDRNAEG